MASRKRITSHKKSRQQEEFRGIAQRRDPEFYGEDDIPDIPYRDRTPAPARKEAPTPKVLPKPKPKPKPKEKSSGVNFDTTGNNRS